MVDLAEIDKHLKILAVELPTVKRHSEHLRKWWVKVDALLDERSMTKELQEAAKAQAMLVS